MLSWREIRLNQCLSPKKMKKLINSPENVVRESIAGLGAAFSDIIKIHTKPNFIIRADALDCWLPNLLKKLCPLFPQIKS